MAPLTEDCFVQPEDGSAPPTRTRMQRYTDLVAGKYVVLPPEFGIMPFRLWRRFLRRLFIFLVVLALSSLAFAQVGWHSLGNVSSVRQLSNGAEIIAGGAKVQVIALAPTVVRLRYSADGSFPPDHSFAVLPDAFPQPPKVQVSDAPAGIFIRTDALEVRITRSPLMASFLDIKGNLISQDHPGYPVAFNGTAFRVWKSMPADEHYFGLGEKSGPLDHREQAFTMWNTDAYGWEQGTDPLYKDIPFFMALRNGVSYGIFLDNTYRTNFDFGKASRDFYSFGADGGALDYYFFYGPHPKKVVENFTQLVGRTPLPPLFALAYQQSRYSYFPESQVREIAAEYRKRKIPLDVLYLDIDYQQDNRPFTVNRERFPNMEGMVKDLAAEGIKTVMISDLHIAKLPGYKPYDEGMAKGYFMKNPDGSVFVGKVWPGDSVFPDFMRPEVRAWYGSLYAGYVKMGVRGFWNDMNEPSVFFRPDKTMPLDVQSDVSGRTADQREIHNVLGMENVHATHDGLVALQPNIRPLVLTRAAYAGTQRYAATWTGDNTSSWDHMRISIPELINLGLSGFAFVGDDIGGYRGGPTAELLTRWMELGAFNPFYRNHAEKGSRNREPWVDGPEHEAIRKKYIEQRYRMLPYIYTSMEESSRTGVPLMRPLSLEFPDDPLLPLYDEGFMFGNDLLVAPKVRTFTKPYFVPMPKFEWYDYWTGLKFKPDKELLGERGIEVDPPLDVLPVYVRAGAIIPQQPVVQHVEEQPQGPLEVRVYPGPDCHGELYQDDGNTLNYLKGEFVRVHFNCEAAAGQVNVSVSAPEGTYKPWFQQMQIVVYGIPKPSAVTVDGNSVTNWTGDGGAVRLAPFAWSGAVHSIKVASNP
jgi:alpha-glucosidase